jgi:membrane protease YdiL (CAAX protease family)
VLLALSTFSRAYLPGIVTTHDDRLSFVLIGTAPGLLVGLLEEVGWTGFAIPRLRQHYGVLATGLAVGVLWGAWHILTNDLWAAGVTAGEVPLSTYIFVSALTFLIGQLPAYRVLMVWVYEHTQSLFVAVLMHASLVFSTFVLGPIGIGGVPILVYGVAVGAGLWLVVAAGAVTTGRQRARLSLRPRMT